MPSEQNIYLKNDEIRSVVLPNGTVLYNGDREYTIEEFLGAGGFGITYRASAKIKVDNVPVDVPFRFAIKEFLMKGGERENGTASVRYPTTLRQQAKEAMKDFVVEANRLNKLSGRSEHIVPVNEVFLENNTAYYVMEYLKGGEVADYVLKKGRLTEEQAIAIIRPIAEAVEVIHQEKLLHLDIKPGNIVFREPPTEHSQCPVLIDFGIAKHFDSKGKPTSTNTPGGYSPGYAPQEQYGAIEHFAPQIDVYALGATLYALLVGKDPKEAYAITEEDILGNLPENISERTRQTILNAMKEKPEQRTPTARAFLDSLRGVFPLQAGFEIASPVTQVKYRITAIREEEQSHPSYIVYDAVIGGEEKDKEESGSLDKEPQETGEGQVEGSLSPKTVLKDSAVVAYVIYELFSKNEFERLDDGSVRGTSDGARRDFLKAVAKTKKKKLEGQKTAKGLPLADYFEANGTTYFAYLVLRQPPIWKRLLQGIANAGKGIARIFAGLFNVVVRGLKVLFDGIISCFRHFFRFGRSAVAKTMAFFRRILKPLAYAIASAAFVAAAFFGGKALLKSCEQEEVVSQEIGGEESANNDSTLEDSIQSDSVDISTETDSIKVGGIVFPPPPITDEKTNDELYDEAKNNRPVNYSALISLADQKYAKAYYDVALYYYNKNDNANAKKYAEMAVRANVNKKEAQALLDKINGPVQETDEQKYQKAKSANDYTSLINLANKDYAKAYYDVASYYYNTRKDNSNAKKYAEMAVRANVNKKQAQALLDKINGPVQETDEQKYQKAKNTNDYTTLVALANKGYAKAYYDVANYYFNQQNYNEAKRYAQRAVNAGVNTDKAKQMLSTIDDLELKQSAFKLGKSLYDKWVASGDSTTRLQALTSLQKADQNNPVVRKMLDVLTNYKRKKY